MQEESHDECLDNIQEKILILLAQHERLEPEQISRFLRSSVEFSLFHLKELRKSGMAVDRGSPEGRAGWELSRDGRAYLAHHGLIS